MVSLALHVASGNGTEDWQRIGGGGRSLSMPFRVEKRSRSSRVSPSLALDRLERWSMVLRVLIIARCRHQAVAVAGTGKGKGTGDGSRRRRCGGEEAAQADCLQ